MVWIARLLSVGVIYILEAINSYRYDRSAVVFAHNDFAIEYHGRNGIVSTRWLSTYLHKGQIAALVELNTLTTGIHLDKDFVALGHDLAIHIAASDPKDIKEFLNQPFVKNPDQSIQSLLVEKSIAMHDSISISRFVRWDTNCGDEDPDPGHDPAMAVGFNAG